MTGGGGDKMKGPQQPRRLPVNYGLIALILVLILIAVLFL
jgi:hypothetical protein